MTSQPPPGGPGQPGPDQPPRSPDGQPPYGQPQQPYGQPRHGQQPYGQPQQPYGQQPPPPQPGQPWGAPPQQPWGQQSWGQPPQGGYGQSPYGAPGRPGGGSSVSADFSKVGLLERLIAGSALLFTLFMALPWYGFDDQGLEGLDTTTNGFSDTVGGRGLFTFEIGYATGPAVLAWLLVLAAAVWVLLPAFTTVRVPVPRTAVTVGLTGAALLLFLITWVDALALADGPDDEVGFSVVAFLGLLTVLAAFVLAVLAFLPDYRARRSGGGQAPAGGPPPGGQQHFGQQFGQQQPYGQQPEPYQQPPPSYPQQPAPPPPPYGGPETPPPAPGRPDGSA